jgi:hypothetical protein
MRVTKLIREYVEKSVAKAIPNKKKEENPLREKYDAIVDEIRDFANSKIEEFFLEYKGEVKAYYGGYDYEHFEENLAQAKRDISIHVSCLRFKSEDDVDKINKELAVCRKNAVEDILINLELGGTKADLDRMIAELGKGE